MKYIAPHIGEIKSGRFEFESLLELPGWQTIMGLQFENLVLNRIMDFKEQLHLKGATIRSAAPYRADGVNGVQVDLMIQTDEVMYVIEIKRRKRIAASIIEEVKSKISKIRRPRRISVRKGIVYDGELAPSVKRGGYFDALVDIGSIMERRF